MKGKEAGLQTRIVKINPKALFVPCENHSLNLVVVDTSKSSTKALLFFGVLTEMYSLFSSTQPWIILKKHVQLSLKYPSATRWESRINCIIPLRYHYSHVVAALKELVNYSLEKKDGNTATEAQFLIVYITSWKFVLSVVIWYDLLFHINKTCKIMQTCGISLEIIELEIKATLAFLGKYCNDGYSTAIIEGREIAKNLDIDSIFAEKRHRKKKQLFGYENEDESDLDSEVMKFKTIFFCNR